MRIVLVLGCSALTACAHSPAPPAPAPAPVPVATNGASSPHPSSPAIAASAPAADVTLLLRPLLSPSPLVHVELTLAHPDPTARLWRIARGTPENVTHATARDGAGDIPLVVQSAPPGVGLLLSRVPGGPVTVTYDVLATGDVPDDPLGLYVVDDRFRGAGEKLVALPAEIEDTRGTVLVQIDGEALRASSAASSLGVGAGRHATLPPHALRFATFMAGSLGIQVIDDPAEGHDEGAWLGYTAFDPRPTVAELAQIRSGLRETLKSHLDAGAWAYLIVSQTRPIGSFTTTARLGSVLLQVGPAEPWSAGIRLSVAQQLAKRWIGGVIRLSADPGHEAEALWFGEGVSRYVAMTVLAKLGLLTPDEVRDVVAGELSVLATSPHRTLDNARLSDLALRDEVARATLMARGALYALRESATLRARTKGERGTMDVLASLVKQAEDRKDSAFPLSAWLEALGKDDPDAGHNFEAAMLRGDLVALPQAALGPCFRADTGEYVAFDPGFDVEQTRSSKEGTLAGVRPGGPAAKVGLKDGDIVTSMQARDGNSDVPVKLSIVRDGTKITVTYPPRGARGRGQTWSRLHNVPDDRCGSPP